MVKLFKRKKGKKTANFKFDGSIKLKDLPIEEYAHVAYAFHVSFLRFERMLKESLLEGYISIQTLERISQEFKISSIRDLAIPKTESVTALFGEESLKSIKLQKTPLEKKEISRAEPAISKPITSPVIPTEEPTIPDTIVPDSIIPKTTVESTETPEIVVPAPKISFSFPSAADAPEASPETTTEPAPITPESPLKPPTIPKISFPASPSSSASPLANPLANIRGRKEEDRATGIAILRKQMLTELKKIRSVVAEQDQ
ncbi:MAG: hypothetical protein KAT16_05800 [Candidatus Heimdallarchaeota archaeon]|nr:hypothetical protein [Candidatus Heimdallarchaeota archaeon]